ncbi:MAG: cytochrome c family protein [Deltaproteobacteria bacterium]|nr:cytochrome c family protein [Deltaproteobacteria bacterium]MBW2447121.1 cytochrome c family protein [Deltaproteobacteria bacterium]
MSGGREGDAGGTGAGSELAPTRSSSDRRVRAATFAVGAVVLMWASSSPLEAFGGDVGTGAIRASDSETVVAPYFSDPARVVGARSCSECHEKEVETWKDTDHYTGAMSLPRSPEAKRIAKALGIRRIKAAEACISCHYTVEQQAGPRPKATQGVSCESCHGAAREWIEVHDKYGEPDATPETETPEHRAERLAACDRAGMNRAERLYGLAARCFACHTTPSEEIVEDGGHPVGGDFELMSWSQGDMRHNYWRGPAGTNEESSAERKRLMYLLGQTLELESALRVLARANAGSSYAERVTGRVRAALERLAAIDALASLPEVRDALRAAEGAMRVANQREAVLDAAAEVESSARTIAENYTGRELAALDARVEALQRSAERRDSGKSGSPAVESGPPADLGG